MIVMPFVCGFQWQELCSYPAMVLTLWGRTLCLPDALSRAERNTD